MHARCGACPHLQRRLTSPRTQVPCQYCHRWASYVWPFAHAKLSCSSSCSSFNKAMEVCLQGVAGMHASAETFTVQARGDPYSPLHGGNQWPSQLPAFEAALRRHVASCLRLGQALMRGARGV